MSYEETSEKILKKDSLEPCAFQLLNRSNELMLCSLSSIDYGDIVKVPKCNQTTCPIWKIMKFLS